MLVGFPPNSVCLLSLESYTILDTKQPNFVFLYLCGDYPSYDKISFLEIKLSVFEMEVKRAK